MRRRLGTPFHQSRPERRPVGRQERLSNHDGARREATAAALNGCNPTGVAAALFSSYYTSNSPLVAGVTGQRYFWSNTLGTIYASATDVFGGETQGNGPPAVGAPIQSLIGVRSPHAVGDDADAIDARALARIDHRDDLAVAQRSVPRDVQRLVAPIAEDLTQLLLEIQRSTPASG